ncbi:MAG: hypothetical protein BWY81_01293 [Firmicutes bacterium ADurb.Bin467]|nr:MAG: hypothetical protein BWY81_01293 [Firmicutes bacterium ADurb.Bin467]
MPGTTWPGWNAACSVSAKKLSTFLLSVILPMRLTGISSSGQNFVGSRMSKPNLCSSAASITWMPNSYSGYSPDSIASQRSRRWKSGSLPASFCASSQTSEWTPSTGFQWNFTNRDVPCWSTSLYVLTPKPSIMR